MPKISVVIPTHEMKNRDFFLERGLFALDTQTFDDFEVVVSDNSEDDMIQEICTEHLQRDYPLFPIRYFRNPIKGMAVNTNEGMKQARGELIKILYLDDYLAHKDSLKVIADSFDGQWMVTACAHDPGTHTHFPTWNDKIREGVNSIGSPSVLTMRREDMLFFDENLSWLLDCELYDRLYKKYGPPQILNDVNVMVGIHEGQMTHLLPDEVKLKEHEYVANKHD